MRLHLRSFYSLVETASVLFSHLLSASWLFTFSSAAFSQELLLAMACVLFTPSTIVCCTVLRFLLGRRHCICAFQSLAVCILFFNFLVNRPLTKVVVGHHDGAGIGSFWSGQWGYPFLVAAGFTKVVVQKDSRVLLFFCGHYMMWMSPSFFSFLLIF